MTLKKTLNQFTNGGAEAVLQTYLKLNRDKIIGHHWLWCVLERVANGESADDVLREFGYVQQGIQQ